MDTPRFVEISFDCLPLRSVGRLDVPIDASPKFRALCESVKRAIEVHGAHNAYFLHHARCIFHLTNDPKIGMIEFEFQGTVLTDANDQTTEQADLTVELVRETCDWLSEPIVAWFKETVRQAVLAEFNHFIVAGDLEKAVERLKRLQSEMDEAGGYLGMYL